MKGRVIVYFILTFMLGSLAGSGGKTLWRKYYRHRLSSQDRKEQYQERIARHLERELSLSEDQSKQVQDIIRDSSRQFYEIREEMELQLKPLREGARKKIEKTLTEKQRERFTEMVHKFEEWRYHRRRRHRH